FLGCVFYEMLTGRSPLLMTRDRHARMQKQRFDNVPPIQPGEVNGPPSLFRLLDTMMSLNPQHRYQTPSQLLDAIRAVRREVEGTTNDRAAASSPRQVFVIEAEERLQDKIRNKFKEYGYRVLMAADPRRALERFRLQPFDALVVDAGTTDEDGFMVFDHIMSEAERQGLNCAGLLILNEDQADWAKKVKPSPRQAVFVRTKDRSVTVLDLHRKLREFFRTPKPE